MLLEDAPGSTRPVGVREPHFPVFAEFRGASYAERYEVTLTRLLREGLYDGTCLILTAKNDGAPTYREPCDELGFRRFAASVAGHAIAAVAER